MSEVRINRRLAAIVAADMVGYSRLMGEDEAGTIARQKAHRAELIDPKVAEFNGRIVKTTGDGLLIEFSSAVDAVRCAVAVQRDMARREADRPADQRIQYRVGVNLGEIVVDGDDILGDGVNIAARVEALAEPGGVYVSEAVFRNVDGKVDFGFVDLGAHAVKNIAEPVTVFRALLDPGDAGNIVPPRRRPARRKRRLGVGIAAAFVVALGLAAFFYLDPFRPAPVTGEVRMLILPYRSADAGGGQLAEAASENLWLTLARLRALTLVSRKESIGLAGTAPTVTQLARLGKVTHILDGTITNSGGKFIVTSRLRQVRGTGRPVVWQSKDTVSAAGLLSALAHQKTSMVAALELKTNDKEREILAATFTRSPGAFLSYARAERIFAVTNWTKLRQGLALYRMAMRSDPAFIAAKVGYAEANLNIWTRNWSVIRNTLEAERAAAKTADDILKADPANTGALSVKVFLEMQNLRRDAALTLARAALFKNLGSPQIRYALAWAYLAKGDTANARKEVTVYLASAPRLRGNRRMALARLFLGLNDPKRVIEILSPMYVKKASVQFFDLEMAQAYWRLGDKVAARRHLKRNMGTFPWMNVTWMKFDYEIYADPAVAKRMVATLTAAGMPMWPFGFDRKHAADRLRHSELKKLFSAGFRATDAKDEFGGKLHFIVRSNGTMELRMSYIQHTYRGTWKIVGDTVCATVPDLYKGRPSCELYFRDRQKSADGRLRYMNLHSFGIRKFSVAPVTK